MTPTTPPAIPSDIPADIREAAWLAYWGAISGDIIEPSMLAAARLDRIARALLAAQERGKLMERERCALVAETRFPQVPAYAAEIAEAIREGN